MKKKRISTRLVRGGINRSRFFETSETLYLTSGYVYKTADEKIEYTSNTVNYDTFKTFSVKVVMTSNNATIVPKVRDLRAIELD